MPFTRLLVLRVDIEGSGKARKYTIHCREVELAITHGLPLLWVDDNIHKPNDEMKRLMERAMVDAGREIKFILKPSTELALAFLRSWFGHRAAANPKFRIMSDMNRTEYRPRGGRREPEGARAMGRPCHGGMAHASSFNQLRPWHGGMNTKFRSGHWPSKG